MTLEDAARAVRDARRERDRVDAERERLEERISALEKEWTIANDKVGKAKAALFAMATGADEEETDE